MDDKLYSAKEERINTLSHLAGLILSVGALTLLAVYSAIYGTVWHIISFSIYGTSLILLYLASTLYHAARNPVRKARFKIIDHAAIFILIAGTYTPFLLVTLNGLWGWSLFGIVWGLALIGIFIKIFFTGKFKVFSTTAYILMGWVIIVAIKPLAENLIFEGLLWLFAGGILYSVGAVFYLIKKLPFNHAIFHFFVLGGSFCHFVSVFFYVLPSS